MVQYHFSAAPANPAARALHIAGMSDFLYLIYGVRPEQKLVLLSDSLVYILTDYHDVVIVFVFVQKTVPPDSPIRHLVMLGTRTCSRRPHRPHPSV